MKTDYGWYDGGNGTNSSGFSGMPGATATAMEFYEAGYYGLWWSSSPYGSFAWFRYLNYNDEGVNRYNGFPQLGFSFVASGMPSERSEPTPSS